MIRDLVVGCPNEWEQLYDPSRKSLAAAGDYLRENANVAAQYVAHVTPGEVHGEADIRPGEGAVMRHGLKKVAVYRDETGAVHRVSAICSHLGCAVCWNSLERSWDCPCHGSRFDIHGKVMNGPAINGLHADNGPR